MNSYSIFLRWLFIWEKICFMKKSNIFKISIINKHTGNQYAIFRILRIISIGTYLMYKVYITLLYVRVLRHIHAISF